MLMAIKLSNYLKYSSIKDFYLVKDHLNTFKLPINLIQISRKKKWQEDRLIKNMYADKKVHKGKLRFILCKGIGKAFIKENIKEVLIKKVIKEFTL